MPLRLPSGLSPRRHETAAAVPDGARCDLGPGFGPGPGGLGPRTEAAGVEEAGGWVAPAAHGPAGPAGTRHNLALSDTPPKTPGADREKPRRDEDLEGFAHGLVVSDNV